MSEHLRCSLLAIVLAACGTSPPGVGSGLDGGVTGTCPLYVVPSTTDLMSPAVSFKSDVMPIFNHSCGSTICHGTTSSPQGGLFLGQESAMTADASTVYANLVGKPSGELSGMAFVSADDPGNSYLMHKLDGDQCAYESACTGGSCMHLMPSDGSEPLPVATRDTVRRWIAQGAMSN
ncbi:MAG TPA: hypothetical protein VLX92_25270 [Kofleriaceae bacterium]|nr:hypothetical protein [Kofleriaceae bacterium]